MLLSQTPSKDMPKQVSQDNIAILSIECVAKYLARLLGVSSQLGHIAKCSHFSLSIPISSSPFNQINNIDMCLSYGL